MEAIRMKPVRNNVRTFTEEEDQWIIAQSRGLMSVDKLRRKLRSGMDAMHRRAQELGVTLCKDVHPEQCTDTLTPARIKDDLLLERLNEIYQERRYGYEEFKR